MKDNIGSSGTSGAVYIRYFAQGSKYAAGTTALTGAKRVHSSQYRISRVALRTVSAAVVDVACTTEIKPTSASFAITYNGVNLAEGKVVKAGGGGAFSAFNYEGFVRQTEVVRTNI